MRSNKTSYLFLLFASVLLSVFLFFYGHDEMEIADAQCDANRCSASSVDTLKVLLFANYSDYFIYRGIPMGFQYELLKIMADSLHRVFDVKIENDPNMAYSAAFSDRYDIVAMDFKKDFIVRQLLDLSSPFAESHAVRVEKRKKTKNVDTLGKTLYVPVHFPMKISIDSLPATTQWTIRQSSYLTEEELFELLQQEAIFSLLADAHTANLLLQFYPDLAVVQTFNSHFPRTWVLNPHHPHLNKQIDTWLVNFCKTKKYKALKRKYFSQYSNVQKVPEAKMLSRAISPYDRIVKKYSSAAGLDWRFVVSIMYQESRFHVQLVGLGGSFGLMQMMPATCERFGITTESSEEEQIQAGVRQLALIQKGFADIKDEVERMKFMAASYNAGMGHVKDARRLCKKYGEDDTAWENVSKYLILKSEREFYTDPVVQCGYYPGQHAVRYTQTVMERYLAYKVTFRKR